MIKLILLWPISGVAIFIFGWTRYRDFTLEELILVLPAAICGPLAYFLAMAMACDDEQNQIIFKKRGHDVN